MREGLLILSAIFWFSSSSVQAEAKCVDGTVFVGRHDPKQVLTIFKDGSRGFLKFKDGKIDRIFAFWSSNSNNYSRVFYEFSTGEGEISSDVIELDLTKENAGFYLILPEIGVQSYYHLPHLKENKDNEDETDRVIALSEIWKKQKCVKITKKQKEMVADLLKGTGAPVLKID